MVPTGIYIITKCLKTVKNLAQFQVIFKMWQSSLKQAN